MGFYMAIGYFSQVKAKSIWEEINKLCRALRPHARSLVDAFEIPDELLASEIAVDYVKAYTYPNVPGGEEKEIKSAL
jgi:acyl-CoA oxidase